MDDQLQETISKVTLALVQKFPRFLFISEMTLE